MFYTWTVLEEGVFLLNRCDGASDRTVEGVWVFVHWSPRQPVNLSDFLGGSCLKRRTYLTTHAPPAMVFPQLLRLLHFHTPTTSRLSEFWWQGQAQYLTQRTPVIIMKLYRYVPSRRRGMCTSRAGKFQSSSPSYGVKTHSGFRTFPQHRPSWCASPKTHI